MNRLLSFLLIGFTAAIATAEETKPTTIIGGVDLRPSWRTTGNARAENYAQLGVALPSGTQLMYRQEFYANLFGPNMTAQGISPSLVEGFVRAKPTDIWSSGNTALGYEGRLYVPTNATKRDAGMVTAVQNQFKLKQKVAGVVTLAFEETPTIHLYNRSGSVKSAGPEANPIFENRIGLSAEYNPMSNVKITLPIYLSHTRFRPYATGASKNDTWVAAAFIWPEVLYLVTPQLALGVAYQTDRAARDISQSFNNGAAQVVLQANL